MIRPWLSVVMPVHNGSRFLPATLDAAILEHPEGVEFVVLDSSDDIESSRALIETYCDRLTIRYHAVPDCKPWTAKTNRGVLMAAAPHVAMLHQDDLWLAGHVAAVRAAITANPKAVLSVGPSRFIDAVGRDVGPWRLPFEAGDIAGKAFIATLIVQNTVAIPSPVILRSAWLACGGMTEELWYTADWDLYLKLARQGPVHVREPASTAFRLHPSSLTMIGSADQIDFQRQHELVIEAHLDALPAQIAGRQLRHAHASAAINGALAQASRGRLGALLEAFGALMRLGPLEIPRLLLETRLKDRIGARLHLAGSGLRYVGGAVLCALINNAILIAGDGAGFTDMAGVLVAWLLGGVAGYLWHSLITFKEPLQMRRLCWFLAGMLIGIPLTWLSILFFRHLVGWPMTLASPATTVVLILYNYFNARIAIVRPKGAERQSGLQTAGQ